MQTRQKPESADVIKKIAVTGGPGAGKSTFLSVVTQWLQDRGWEVLIAPEAATYLITAGLAPWKEWSRDTDFQDFNMQKLLDTEDMFIKAAQKIAPDKPKVILCDRGVMDAQAYVGKEKFGEVLSQAGLSLNQALDRYDGVIFLHSAAEGAEHGYTLENNEARTESPEQARDVNAKTLDAWKGHQHLIIIESSDDFERKIEKAKKATAHILGIPEPLEIERKFLLATLPGDIPEDAVKVKIRQDYLEVEGKGERRIRKRLVEGSTRPSFFYTEKREIKPGKRFEIEKEIDPVQYIALLDEVDLRYRPIFKTRHCFVYENQYFELDVFEKYWEGLRLLEVELTEENKEVSLPPFLTVVEEVTGSKEYSNRRLARIRNY